MVCSVGVRALAFGVSGGGLKKGRARGGGVTAHVGKDTSGNIQFRYVKLLGRKSRLRVASIKKAQSRIHHPTLYGSSSRLWLWTTVNSSDTSYEGGGVVG